MGWPKQFVEWELANQKCDISEDTFGAISIPTSVAMESNL